MIAGTVNPKLEAVLTIQVLDANEQPVELQTVIDTGYNGYLTLPVSIVSTLSLPKGATREVTLGDASRKAFDYYTATLLWDGQRHRIRVLCVEGDPLTGTALLAGYKLETDFVVGGSVSIRPLA